jgi:hypothetical protein
MTTKHEISAKKATDLLADILLIGKSEIAPRRNLA